MLIGGEISLFLKAVFLHQVAEKFSSSLHHTYHHLINFLDFKTGGDLNCRSPNTSFVLILHDFFWDTQKLHNTSKKFTGSNKNPVY